MQPMPETWVSLMVGTLVGEENLGDFLPEAERFHLQCSGAAAAHLNLVANNTFRTPWLAAKLLLTDPPAARDAAGALVKLVSSTPPRSRTQFEEYLLQDEELWEALTSFAKAEPPTKLWQGGLRYEALLRFLAPRFLLAPDHVLDAERVHARWQWACSVKRRQTMQSLNAELRLRHHLDRKADPPDFEELCEHLIAEQEHVRLRLQALHEAEDIARGDRASWLYRQRLGLSASQHALLEAPHDPTAARSSPFVTAWRTYLRELFVKHFVFTVSARPSVFLYAMENKIMPGKEVRDGDSEPVGHKLIFTFMEAMPDDPLLLRRAHREDHVMRQDLLSLAELLQTLGIRLPYDPERTAAAAERILEASFMNLSITRWAVEQEVRHQDPLVFSISADQDTDDVMALKDDADTCTKMTLVRFLQRRDLLAEEESLKDT